MSPINADWSAFAGSINLHEQCLLVRGTRSKRSGTINEHRPTFVSLAVKTIVVHSVTYFVCGLLAFLILDYESKFADPAVRILMRQTDEPIVMAGPLFQPIRGLLFAVAFYPLRATLFGQKHGWMTMWIMLVVVGILSTFGPSPGSIEGMIYTVFPIQLQLFGMPEVLAQSLLLSLLLCFWVNRPEKRWLNWTFGVAFFFVISLPTLGLLIGPTQ